MGRMIAFQVELNIKYSVVTTVLAYQKSFLVLSFYENIQVDTKKPLSTESCVLNALILLTNKHL